MTRTLWTLLTVSALTTLAACGDKGSDEDEDGDDTGAAETDADGDGFAADEDCDDEDATAYPGAEEVCDGVDNNCDDQIDEGVLETFYTDADGDGFGDPAAVVEACETASGLVGNDSDCDDSDAAVNPSAEEVCNDVDDNCDGEIDEDTATDAATWYADVDGDGFGDASTTAVACDAPSGFVADDTDCDDAVDTVNPGADEVCNDVDDNCDGVVDEDTAVDATTWYTDADVDGYGDATTGANSCTQPSGAVTDDTDCDDGDAAVNPGADEVCNGVDDNCDGTTDEDTATDASTWYADTDVDGYGDAGTTSVACDQPSGYVADDTDCDDTNTDVNPGQDEVCNTIDDNCDGDIDEDTAIDVSTWYADTDTDGYGDPSSSDIDCDQPSGYVSDDTDCDDTDAAVNPAATEICNGVDDDCDATTSEDGMASWDDGSGSLTDVSSLLTGTSSAPANYTFSAAGTLWLCDGTYYANVVVEDDVTFAGVSGDETAVVIDGGQADSIIYADTDGVEIEVSDLTLTNGYPSHSGGYADSGGAVYCEGSTASASAVSLDNVVVDANYSDAYGGGVFAYGCDLATSNGTTISTNDSDLGGGVLVVSGALTLDDTEISDNTATDVAGLYLIEGAASITDSAITGNLATDEVGGAFLAVGATSVSVTIDELEVSDNEAADVGGIGFEGGTITWAGTSTTASGVTGNIDDTYGGLFLNGAEATFTSVDFGTAAGADDNEPYDVWNTAPHLYRAEDDDSFTCDASGCGTEVTSTVGDTSNSGSGTWILMNTALADKDATLHGFEIYLAPATPECTVDYYVFSSATGLETDPWTLEWSDTGNPGDAGTGFYGPGDVEMIMESGTYYAIGAGWSCSTTYYWSTAASSTDDMGFGTSGNYIYSSDETTRTTDDTFSEYSGALWYMNVYTTDL